uniref:G-protein coupled receptors family 1 profile domain-containing protein n=1 Tax=Acrobeloides nanus TaxID=290746 RepID=A0A914CN48_9BILA
MNEIVRATRASSTLIGVLLYIPITIKIRLVVRATDQASEHSISPGQLKQLIRYNVIVCLIILNEFILIVVPDFVIIVWPNTPLKNILFSLTLTKSLITVLIMLIAQEELRFQCYTVIIYLFNRITRTSVNTSQSNVVMPFKRTQNHTA